MAKKKNPAIRFLDPTVESFETIVGPRTVFRGNIAAFESIRIDGKDIPFESGQTIMEAAQAAGVYIPHLCHHPEFTPHGSCKLCTIKVNGRTCSACTMPAMAGQEILNDTGDLNATRRRITQMLFVEGNHFCPGCEKSGDCQLQAVGYFLGMEDTHFPHFFPKIGRAHV